jgi:hydroxymethylpyrimidine kinase/phosphomethylpyrimidine kinase
MLANGGIARVIAEYLEHYSPPNVVLDPILRSSSGTALLDEAGLALLRTRLLPCAHVITPNLEEAGILAGQTISSPEQIAVVAERLHQLGARSVVITGGHLPGRETVELLSVHGGSGAQQQEFRGPKLETRATHGTGCAFATALACNLALGWPLPDAVAAAKHYVFTAMSRAYRLGSGAGPLHHLYGLEDKRHPR